MVHLRAMFTASLCAVGLAVAPASASNLVHEHYSESGTDVYEDCGMQVSNEFENSGLFTLRLRSSNPTPYLADRYRYRSVITNLDNGKWMVQQGHGRYKDLRITLVEGTVYRFVAIEAGQPFTMTSMDGERIIFDRGVLRTTFLVDTHGDADLENDEFIEDSFEVVADRGRHPGFYIDYCETLQELIG